jgi:thiamine-monophosphate kinase
MTIRMTNIDTLGRAGLLDHLRQQLPVAVQPTTVAGTGPDRSGDDAAVTTVSDTEFGLMAHALLLEGVHFDLTYMPLKHLGFKAIGVAVSDIAAMNGLPQQVSVGVGLSSRFTVEAVDELYAGLRTGCDNYGIDFVSNQVTSSRAGLTISVAVLGRVPTNQIAYRHTAQAGDVLCVTGELGAAYLGLQLLEREKAEFLANPDMQPDLSEERAYLVQRQLRPEARTDIVHELRDLKLQPSAMIGLPNGLADGLRTLCRDSNTGAIVFDENLPIDDQTYLAADEFRINPITAALNGGDDYELLFTLRPQDFEPLKNHARITAIGYLTNSGQVMLSTKAGVQSAIE